MKGSWKLIQDGSRVELYDLSNDPRESHNLIRENDEVTKSLFAELAAFS